MRNNLTKVRRRASYHDWRRLAEFLDGNPTKAEVMRHIHGILNGHSAYGSITMADFAKESLELVLQERTKVTCRSCGWAGTQADCDFGHNDFYCPQCGKEDLRTHAPAVKAGASYSGDEIVEALGGDMQDGLYAIGNDGTIVVAEDEGNDNYRVLVVVEHNREQLVCSEGR